MSTQFTEETIAGSEISEDGVVARVEAAIAARKRAVDLLKAVGIERVVWLDDQHASSGTPDSKQSVLDGSQDDGLRPMLLAEVTQDGFTVEDEVDPLSADDVSRWLDEHWEEFDHALRERLTLLPRRAEVLDDRTPRLAPKEREDDLNAIPVLDLFRDDDIDLRALSLSEWRLSRESLLQDPPSTLILVDLDFSAEGFSNTAGEDVLRDLLQLAQDNVVAGVLSHNLKSEDEERDWANDFADRLRIDIGKVAAIGKFRQRGENSIPEALRALFLAEELESYRKLAAEAFARANERVQQRLVELHRYTLLSSIDAGIKEGTFELDVPLRILANEVRRELTVATRLDPRTKSILSGLRENSTRKAYVAAGTRNPQVHEILWKDVFDDVSDLHQLNLPIEVGDLFEIFAADPKSKSKKLSRWILLAQSCDLTVRADGRRAHELSTLVLTEVIKLPARPKAYQHELGQIDRDGTAWAVDVTSRLIVPTRAIDATVFGADGESVLPSPSPTAPIATGWEKRRSNFNSKAIAWSREYASAVKMVDGSKEKGEKDLLKRRIASALTGASMNVEDGVPVFIDISGTEIKFGVRRTGRVTPQRASFLFELAHGYQSRPATEADVASLPKPWS
jgi:hypothetical protein